MENDIRAKLEAAAAIIMVRKDFQFWIKVSMMSFNFFTFSGTAESG